MVYTAWELIDKGDGNLILGLYISWRGHKWASEMFENKNQDQITRIIECVIPVEH